MFQSKKFQLLYGCLLVCISFSVLALPDLYDVIVNSGKNKYTVTAPELDPKQSNTLGLMLTIAVDKPQKDTITITAEDEGGRNWLGGDQIESFLNTSHPELASDVKLIDRGIQLKIKASNQKVVIKIPVTILESMTTTFKIKRDKYTVKEIKATYVRKDKSDVTEEDSSSDETPIVSPTSQKKLVNQANTNSLNMFSDIPQQPTMLKAAHANKETATQTKMVPLNTPSVSEASGETKQVFNYEQLVAAINDENINRIEFMNEIIALDIQPLPVINRSLVIDGRGNKFATTGYQIRDMIKLENSGKDRLRFTITNMKVERFGTGGAVLLYKGNKGTSVKGQLGDKFGGCRIHRK